MTRACLISALLAGCAAFAMFVARADEPPAAAKTQTPKRTIDDELMKDLDNELLKDLGPVKPASPTKDAAPPIEPERPTSPPPPDLSPDSDEAGHPLEKIGRSMRSSEDLIPKRAERTNTGKVQQQIVEDLEKLIKEVEKQSSSKSKSKSSSQSNSKQKQNERKSVNQPQQQQQPQQNTKQANSNQPAQDSTDRMGEAKQVRVDPEAMRGLMKDAWGHLPAHAREEMLQTSPERFLPQYEMMIERYYRRLAEEQGNK